jgi:hypothetical protein
MVIARVPFRSVSVATVLMTVGFASIAFGGADNAKLDCESATSSETSTRLSGDVPGDFAEFSLKLEVEGSSILMSSPDDKIEVVTELSKGVFTLTVEHSDRRSLRLYAVPSSVKVKGGSRRLFNATFDAVMLQAPKPGYSGPPTAASLVKDIKLTCTLKHHI